MSLFQQRPIYVNSRPKVAFYIYLFLLSILASSLYLILYEINVNEFLYPRIYLNLKNRYHLCGTDRCLHSSMKKIVFATISCLSQQSTCFGIFMVLASCQRYSYPFLQYCASFLQISPPSSSLDQASSPSFPFSLVLNRLLQQNESVFPEISET